jgi:hypothetical protein
LDNHAPAPFSASTTPQSIQVTLNNLKITATPAHTLTIEKSANPR